MSRTTGRTDYFLHKRFHAARVAAAVGAACLGRSAVTLHAMQGRFQGLAA